MDEKKFENLDAETVEETVEACECGCGDACECDGECQCDGGCECGCCEEEATENIAFENASVQFEDGGFGVPSYQFDGGNYDKVTEEKANTGAIAGIIGGIVALILVIAWVGIYSVGFLNPYNMMYIDTTGKNLSDLANENGFTVNEYKKITKLPFFMPASTSENAVNNSIKLSSIVESSGLEFKQYAEYYGWGSDITEDSTIGEGLAATKLSVILGVTDASDASFQEFREFYGFTDEITPDTLYGEVRKRIDKKTKADRIAEEKAEKVEKAEEDATEEGADAPNEEAPVEEAPTE